MNHLDDIGTFRDEFMNLTIAWDWQVEGFVDSKNQIYPIDTDTKVLSTVFERLSSPVIRSIAKACGYQVETSNQTTYPDFTLTKQDGPGSRRIGLDVKTTYLSSRMVLTLGSYGSFLRNNKKNILYPYNTYSEHWILGFVYKQGSPFPPYDLSNIPLRGVVPCPYTIEKVFIRNKHELAGLRPGSGNTKNIGSFITNSAEEFQQIRGPFAHFRHAKSACDHFWSKYEDYAASIRTTEQLKQHPDFQIFDPF